MWLSGGVDRADRSARMLLMRTQVRDWQKKRLTTATEERLFAICMSRKHAVGVLAERARMCA